MESAAAVVISAWSITTRFPVTKSCATGFSATLEELEDQTVLFISSERIRLPFSDNFKAPLESGSGFSLFATHTTTSGNFLYHSPKYHAVELGGEKSPSTNLWLEVTKISEPVMDSDAEMVSAAMEKCKAKCRNREMKMKIRTFISVGICSGNIPVSNSIYNIVSEQCRSQHGTII